MRHTEKTTGAVPAFLWTWPTWCYQWRRSGKHTVMGVGLRRNAGSTVWSNQVLPPVGCKRAVPQQSRAQPSFLAQRRTRAPRPRSRSRPGETFVAVVEDPPDGQEPRCAMEEDRASSSISCKLAVSRQEVQVPESRAPNPGRAKQRRRPLNRLWIAGTG